ncbi:MAG: sulfate ABC transporter substrate-binding protein [Rhodocyclales bacterium]|nr:sulfate ABC transporter substrate-binding protein [Rhodocyclales bacterium]
MFFTFKPAHTPRRLLGALLASLSLAAPGWVRADTTLLNVSYDVTRELYKDLNPAFVAQWQKSAGEKLAIKQSNGGSTKQVQSVLAGLDADVITMNQPPDVDALAKGGLVAADWRKAFPHNATPYTTTTIFLVRKGNPKGIKDWADLLKPGVEVIIPNPKTSGNGRYTYLAAWVYGLQKSGTEAGARDYVSKLFARVPVLDGGGRGATTTFTQRDMGDVLITFENEAILIDQEVGGDKFDVVYPSVSVEASPPVAVVGKVVDKRGTRRQAEAYLNFLYTPAAQEIIARHHFRPRDESILRKYASQFPKVKTFSVEDALGGWEKAQKLHFSDGGVYDQIVTRR